MFIFRSKPCRSGEAIRVWVDGVPLDFKIPILIERTSNVYDLHIYIDSSGSMNNDSFQPPLSVQLTNVIPVSKNYTIFYPLNERWVQWFEQSISRKTKRVTLIFIDESIPYSDIVSGQELTQGTIDSYGHETYEFVLVERETSPELIYDLDAFRQKYNNGMSSFGNLYIVGSEDALIQQAFYAWQNELGGTGYKYENISRYSNVGEKIQNLLSPKSSNFVKIFVLQKDRWSELRESIRGFSPAPYNDLIEDSFFSTQVFEKRSDTEIDVQWTCENRCPPGYCEIETSMHPYYCCVR